MYTFINIHECNLCKSTVKFHKLLGNRFNRSQGFFFKKNKKDISTNVFICKKCNTVFSNPIPIPINNFQRYELLVYKEMLNFDKKIFDIELNYLKKIFNSKIKINFLEIGSGNGFLVNKLNENGFDAYGIEPVKKFYKFSINQFPNIKNKFYNKSIEEINLAGKKFNIISFNSVLEHLHDPSNQLKKAFKLLDKNGLIHVEVPNSNWLISKLINLFKFFTFQNNITNLSPMHSPFHYYEFSLKSFIQNGAFNGYKIYHYYYRVSEIEFKLPTFLKKILYIIMKKTNTGKQLVVFLKKL